MSERYKGFKFEKFGILNIEGGWDDYILVTDSNYKGLLKDPDDPVLNEYFADIFCYEGNPFCDSVGIYKESCDNDKLIIVVHHRLTE